MKQKSPKKVIIIIISAICAIITVSIPYILGLIISSTFNIDNNTLYKATTILNAFVYLIFFVNLCIEHRNTKKLSKIKPSEAFNEMVSIKELNTQTDLIQKKLLSNYKKAFVKVIIAYTFYALLLFLNGLNYHVFQKLSEDFTLNELYFTSSTFALLFIVIIIFAVSTMYYKLFTKNDKENSKELYPHIYELIENEFKKEGINKEFIIDITEDCNLGIFEYKNKIGINISYILLKLFTDDELKSALYHEIAHYKNKDTEYLAEVHKYVRRLETLVPFRTNVFLAPNLGKVAVESEKLLYATNILFEYKADDLVLEKGLSSPYSDAIFKVFALEFAFENASYLDYYLFLGKNLKIDEESFNIKLNIIKSFYYKHLDFFLYSSKHYLSPILITHPTIKERLEKFNTGKEINTELANNTAYDGDIKKYISKSNEDFQNNIPVLNNFKNDYKDFNGKYLSEKESLIKENFNEDKEELLSILQSSVDYADLDFTKDVAKKIIELDPNCIPAKYLLGVVLFKYELDSSCLPYLIDVQKDHSDYGNAAHALLLEYYNYTGMKEEKDKLKEHTFEKLDLAFTQKIQYVYGEKLLPYENKEVIDRVVELAKECDDILHIVAGTKKKKDLELNVFVFYIEYMKDEPSDFEPTISKIQTYLDSIGPNYRSYAFFIKQVHFRYRKPIFNIYDHKNK